MDSILKIIAFVMLFVPTIYQAIAGFRTKDKAVVKKVAGQAVIMQVIGTLLAYFIFMKIGNDKMIAIYGGFVFFLSLILLIFIQNILLFLKNNNQN